MTRRGKFALLLGLTLGLPIFSAAAEEPAKESKTVRTFGIDISHYQGHVNWTNLAASPKKVNYVFMRSTMGDSEKDRQFHRNWKEAKKKGFIRGAYHYYRPSTNSAKQFNNYKKHVTLEKGDFPPILDIEQIGKYGADNTIRGVKNWLRLAEAHYGVKPIVYTGRKFYQEHLKGHVNGYVLWIASYSPDPHMKWIKWTFHQYSDDLRIQGIEGPVDGNHFKGNMEELKNLCIAR